MLILVTGATGKVGRSLIARLTDDPRFSKARISALCHNRLLDEIDRIEVVRGSGRASAFRRQPCGASCNLKRNPRRRHGRDGQGPVPAARGIPHQPEWTAIYPDRRRRWCRPLLLPSRHSDHGRNTAHGVPRQLRGVEGPGRGIPSRFHSNWADNNKAKHLLDWEPDYDLERLIDSAWQYERPRNDARVVWYPG